MTGSINLHIFLYIAKWNSNFFVFPLNSPRLTAKSSMNFGACKRLNHLSGFPAAGDVVVNPIENKKWQQVFWLFTFSSFPLFLLEGDYSLRRFHKRPCWKEKLSIILSSQNWPTGPSRFLFRVITRHHNNTTQAWATLSSWAGPAFRCWGVCCVWFDRRILHVKNWTTVSLPSHFTKRTGRK